jgi:hypothetical protein
MAHSTIKQLNYSTIPIQTIQQYYFPCWYGNFLEAFLINPSTSLVVDEPTLPDAW